MLERPSADFLNAKSILENPNLFYQELLLAEDADAAAFCPLLKDYSLQPQTLKNYFYIVAAMQRLNCRVDLESAVIVALKEIQSNSFANYFYSIKILKEAERDITPYCQRVSDFYAKDGKFSSLSSKHTSSYYYAAIASEIIADCERVGVVGSLSLQQLLGEAEKGVEELGPDIAALLSDSQTFFVTIKFLNLFLEGEPRVASPLLLAKMIRFVDQHLPLTLENQLKAEYNRFLSLMQTVDAVSLPELVNVELCAESCSVVLRPPRARRAVFSLGGEKRELQSSAAGEFLIERRELERADYLSVEAAGDGPLSYFAASEIPLFRANGVLAARGRAGARAAAAELAGAGQCAEISLEATQDDFLTLSFELKRPTQFAFVQLVPVDGGERATPVLASRDARSGAYLAALDLGDYEVVRPNSGLYAIVVLADEWSSLAAAPRNAFGCGSVSLSFRNAARAVKGLPSDPFPVAESVYEHRALPPRPHLLVTLYFAAAALAFFALYLSVLRRYFWSLGRRPGAWEAGLLLSALLIVAHTLYLAARRLLIENVWAVALEAALFSFVAHKAFAA